MDEKNFTRDRKLSFSGAIVFLMNMVRKTLAVEIEDFVKHLKTEVEKTSVQLFTKSAFTQCRSKIKPEVFKDLASSLTDEFYTDNDASVKLWRGFRLLAVDGSKVRLPNKKKLQEKYGTSRNQNGNGSAQGRISVLYDTLNGFVIEGALVPLKKGETTLAYEHAKQTSKGDLVIYDRGYASFRLVFEHQKSGADFLIRAKKDFSSLTKKFASSGKATDIVENGTGK